MADETGVYTTNAEDKAEVSKLKESLSCDIGVHINRIFTKVPSVSIDEGAHKYVLISAKEPGSTEPSWFVISLQGAAYHRNAAEPTIQALRASGYHDINVTGGGRINYDEENEQISIFGFSYGFGAARHELSRKVIKEDQRYKDYDVTWSNDGY